MSVVIPVYNGSGTIRDLCARLEKTLPELCDRHEIILIDDGSRDGSWDVIRDLASGSDGIRGIRLSRNAGQHNAVLCGIRAARYGIIVTIDDDLQHPPEEIHKLIERLGEGYDVVYGTPQKEQHGFWRDLASRLTKLALQSAMGIATARDVSAFRAIRTFVREAFADYRNPYVSIDVLLTWGTSRFSSVRVRHEPRLVGQSNYTFRKLVVHSFNMLTGFSVWPLQIASLIGFAFTLFGILVLMFVLGRYLVSGAAVPGFAFLASIISLFSGAQLFAIGIIGEYLARMHFRSMERPPYVVGEQVSRCRDQG